ncbi:two component transcriptional regulator, AraC family [Clostridium amylolyticum]|uniref:Stage 0 sporulation protein A homolog n=1 Tax=Clostridium amylolyticum TaxID=1121298 RepID=A0A1M6C7D6_9CLOT|nr:response regulator [Clostridium amylolyticum]SHI56691.1 two component transcriptional regulator, AraC family [Clostridium amylolyticum]
MSKVDMCKIMIVDDEPKIRRGLIKKIKLLNLPIEEFIECEDGKSALEKYRIHKVPIVIADINMPYMNGLEFIHNINSIQKEAAIIILSGYDRFDYAQKAISLNVMEYLLKPVSQEDLHKTLIKALDNTKALWTDNRGLTDTVARIKGYIEKNYYSENLNLTSVAAFFELSEAYISSLMKKELGLSFNEYVTNVRIESAKKLLKEQGRAIKIYQVAELVGYNSQHYFCRVFKKITGVSPIEYISLNFHVKD